MRGNLSKRTRDYLDHGAPEGVRNEELFAAAVQCRDAGFAISEAYRLLMPRPVRDGLSEAEARRTIDSAYSRQAREPIDGADCFYERNSASSIPGNQNDAKVASKPRPTPPPKARTLPDPIPDGFKLLLESCFREGEGVAVSDTKPNASGEHKPGPGDVRTREEWLEKVARRPISEIYPNHRNGFFIRINPMRTGGKTDIDVTNFRHVLVEFDLDEKGKPIQKELQFGALIDSGFPISCIIDSGNKSLHGWARVDAPNRVEYDRRRDLIWENFKSTNLDRQNRNPSRYRRAPGIERNLYDKTGNLVGTGQQHLLATDLGAATWDEWEEAQRIFNSGNYQQTPAEIVAELAIYYDSERTCFWLQDDRANWIKVTEPSVTRHLTELGYRSAKRKCETISETSLLVNTIQRSMNVDYAGSLAGYPKGVLEFQNRRILIVDEPKLIEPIPGNWPILRQVLDNVLDAENTDQIKYFHGWMKIALIALRTHTPRPGQALVHCYIDC
jgi:hypothetical protein